MKNVALSVAKGLYNGKETPTALACSASVGRDEHAPSHRPDALRESDTNRTLRKPPVAITGDCFDDTIGFLHDLV